jgi:hypothetical protein
MLKFKPPSQFIVCHEALSYAQFRERYRATERQPGFMQTVTRLTATQETRLIFIDQEQPAALFLDQATNMEVRTQKLADWYRSLIIPRPTAH